MINRTVLVGRLTKDPELKYTPQGVAVVAFTIAVNRTFTNGQGEKEADFINCVVWRKAAENLANFQKKGNLIGVEGRIQTRSYENQQGQKVYVTEVVADSIQFLDSVNKNQGNNPNQQQGNNGGYNNPNQQQGNNPNQQQQGNNGGYNPNQQQGNGGYPNQQQQGNNGGYNPNQQQGNGGYPNQQQQGGGYNPNQQQGGSPSPFANDPFANGGGPVAVSEDDLPF